MEDEEAQQEQDMSEETEKADEALVSKRDHVPTRLEVYYHDLAYKPLPAVDIRSRDTVEGMRSGAPWLLAKDEFGKVEKRSMIHDDIKEKTEGFSLEGLGKRRNCELYRTLYLNVCLDKIII